MKLGEFPEKQGHKWHCGQCDKHVYDLSEMGPERAAKLIQERAHGKEVCAQWVADRHGNVVFNTAWAAAAAAVVTLATPAFADGGDNVFDAIQMLIEENNQANEAAHNQATVPSGNVSGTVEETHYPMAGGISRMTPIATPPTPPTKP